MAIANYAPKIASPRIWRPDGAPFYWAYMDAPGRAFAGDSGDVADLTGHGRAATRSAGCSWVDGPRGKCLATTGSGGAQIPAFGLTLSSMTILGRFLATGAQTAFAGVVYMRGTGGACGMNVSPNGLNLGYTWNSLGATFSWNSGLAIPTGRWFGWAMSLSPASTTLYLHDQGSLTAATNAVANASHNFTGADQGFSIGVDPGGTGWVGSIDDVRFSSRALSAAEVAREFADPDWRLRRPSAARSFAFPAPPIAGSGSAAAVATATGSSSLAIRGSVAGSAAATATATGSLAMIGAVAASALASALATALLALAGSGSAGSVATASASGSIAGVVAGSAAATATAAASGTLRVAGSAFAGSAASTSARLAPAGAPPTTTGSPDPDRTTWAIVAAVPDPDRTVFDML